MIREHIHGYIWPCVKNHLVHLHFLKVEVITPHAVIVSSVIFTCCPIRKVCPRVDRGGTVSIGLLSSTKMSCLIIQITSHLTKYSELGRPAEVVFLAMPISSGSVILSSGMLTSSQISLRIESNISSTTARTDNDSRSMSEGSSFPTSSCVESRKIYYDVNWSLVEPYSTA